MKTYTKEEALKKSVEYFDGDELAAEVFVSKYAMKNEKIFSTR
jgi:ribonucleoside-diphosphate reductase alpha chain